MASNQGLTVDDRLELHIQPFCGLSAENHSVEEDLMID
jgi:hypothetical protein